MSEISKNAARQQFLSQEKPGQQDFRDLIDSIRFGTEVGDSASTSRHGLIKLATQALMAAKASQDASGFSLAVNPSQLPRVKAKAGATIVVTEDLSGVYPEYEIDDAGITALISAISVPSNGAWVNIGAYTAGGVDNEFDEGWGNVGVTRVRAIAHDQVEIKGKVQLTLADTSLINILQLASTYRPAASDIEFPAVAFSANNWSQEKVILKVLSTGKLTIEGIIPTNAIIPFHIIYTKT